MRFSILALLFALCPLLFAQSGDLSKISFDGPKTEQDSKYSADPLGYEAVTGFRSEYLFRGRKLAEEILDFQLHGYFAYADDKHLEYGLWHASATGENNFQENGVVMHYMEDYGPWTYGAGFRYRNLTGTNFESGFELNTTVQYYFNEDQILSAELSYDTGAKGWYAKIQYEHFLELNADSFLSFKAGLSGSIDYDEALGLDQEDSNGFNDFFAQLSYTYNLTKQISFSPFIATSIQKKNATFFGGLWFETSF